MAELMLPVDCRRTAARPSGAAAAASPDDRRHEVCQRFLRKPDDFVNFAGMRPGKASVGDEVNVSHWAAPSS